MEIHYRVGLRYRASRPEASRTGRRLHCGLSNRCGYKYDDRWLGATNARRSNRSFPDWCISLAFAARTPLFHEVVSARPADPG
jgi:hypothetical protein